MEVHRDELVEEEEIEESKKTPLETDDVRHDTSGETAVEDEAPEGEAAQETPYFEDPRMDAAFQDYLQDPLKLIGEINSEISRLEAGGTREEREAVEYWLGIQEKLMGKYSELNDVKQDVFDPKLTAEERIELFQKGRRSSKTLRKALDFRDPSLSSEERIEAFRELKKPESPDNGTRLSQRDRVDLWKAVERGSASGKGIFDPMLSSDERIALFKASKQK